MSAVDVAVLALGLLLGGAVGAAGYAVLRPSRGGEVRLTITRGALPPAAPPEPATGVLALDPPMAAGDRPPDALTRRPERAPSAAISVGQGRDPTFARLIRTAAEAQRGGMAPRPAASPGEDIVTRGEPVAVAANVAGASAGRINRSTAPARTAIALPAGTLERGAGRPAMTADVSPEISGRSAPPGDASADGTGGASAPSDPHEPCAPERRLAAERCALAARLRDAHRAVVAEQRDLKRAYDEGVNRAEAAGRSIDGRAVLDSKAEAQRRFRRSRLAATSPREMEEAARIWLEEIDRINRAVRQGRATLVAEQERTARLLTALEETSIRVDAARIASESAEERCRQAREALAGCEESVSSPLATRASVPRAPAPPFLTGPGASEAAAGAVPSMAVAPGEPDALLPEPLVLPIARGDKAALGRVVEMLGVSSVEEERRWRDALSEFVIAVRAAAVDAGALVFPTDHPFWSNFTQAECRDVATALASLGYRFDGEGGFVEDRLPPQRDLSLAVGYAGLDPLRIRRWPGEDGTRELYRDVGVAAGEFLAVAAPDLTLSELIEALGRRAEALTDLWNAWGRVRPLLLAPA